MRRRVFIQGVGAAAAVPAPFALRASAAEADPDSTRLPLGAFEGATDDERLSAFMAWSAERSLKGTTVVLDEPRDYLFTKQQTLYSGFSIAGPARPQDQARSSLPIGNRVRLSTSGGWFRLPSGTTAGVSMQGLSIDGGAGSRLIEGSDADGNVLTTSNFRDISMQNAAGVFGSKDNKLLVTACSIDGWWNINNVRDTAWNLGGSDSFIAPSMMLLDSPQALLGATEYLARCSSLSKSSIERLYVTAEGHSAFLFEGRSDNVQLHNCFIEGRNAGAPSPGALIRVHGSDVTLRDNWYAYAMADPSATGRDDGGVIHVRGGTVIVDGATYEPADGVAPSVPFLHASGGRVRVRNVMGKGFAEKPVVHQSTAGLIDADDSVTVRTGA